MMTIEEIQEAIAGLPHGEKVELAAWLNESCYDDWDRQMVADFSPGGCGMELVENVRRQIAEGKASPMEEGFAQRRIPRA